MRRTLLAVVSVLASSILTANAADMAARPTYKAPPLPPAPVFSWTGCYVGGNLGGGRTISILNSQRWRGAF